MLSGMGIFFWLRNSRRGLTVTVGRPPWMAEVPVLQEQKPVMVIRDLPGGKSLTPPGQPFGLSKMLRILSGVPAMDPRCTQGIPVILMLSGMGFEVWRGTNSSPLRGRPMGCPKCFAFCQAFI